MKNYLELLRHVYTYGEDTIDRTKVGTRAIFDARLEWNLQEGFPVVTTKAFAKKACFGELLWFISGSTNIRELSFRTFGDNDHKTIWTANYENQAKNLGYSNGNLGPVYGKQWRDFNGVDQLQNLVDSLRNDPFGRRHIVSSWNPPELDKMALPPCHWSFECYVSQSNQLSLKWHQRSVDMFLGLPFNIASYALLLHILAKLTGYTPHRLIFDGGNVHIYHNHFDAVKTQLTRHPYISPTLLINPYRKLEELDDLLEFIPEDFDFLGYTHSPAISATMAV